MSTDELPERAVTLGRLLHSAGGRASVTELREQAGMSHGTAAKAIAELEAGGLVERVAGARSAPRLTSAGLVRFAGVEPVSAGEVVDAAAAVWPYTHAAFLRLYLAAVVARHHLGDAGPHLGFVAVGEPNTGKSALFEQACHVLGLDAGLHTRELALMTAGEITGRRSMAGSAATFTPAAYLARPAILFDEFDKADRALRERAQKVLLQGKFRTVVDDEQLEVRCAPMLAANLPDETDRFGHVHPAYRTRRSVLLDTGTVPEQLRDLDERLSSYYASRPPGELDLARLVPPARALPTSIGRPLWRQLREQFVAPERAGDFPDPRALDLLALGYAALRGVGPDDEAGLALAAIFVVVDWHACASTVPGLVNAAAGPPELQEAHEAYYGGRGDLASLEAAIAAQHAGTAARAAAAHARQRTRVRVADDVVRGRGELDEQLRLARDAIAGTKVPAELKPAAAGLRDVLGKLRTSVQQLGRPEALTEARERAAQPLREARQLAERIAGDKAAAQRARDDAAAAEKRSKADAKTAAQQQRAYQRQVAKQATTQARAQLAAVREVLRELEKLYRRSRTSPDDRPLHELEQLRVVSYQADLAAANVERPKGWRRVFAGPDPWPGRWVALDGTAYPGGPGSCPGLAIWGNGTRAVLAAALCDGYAEEIQLEGRLGVKPRAGRLALPARPQAVAASSRTALPPVGARYGITRG